MKGFIHSFETFGTVDGPGIRFVVFFSGCPLRCLYCHNPDTWDIKHHKMELTANEIVDEYLKYKNYYTNGGVTISGGEPLLQLDFLIEVLKEFKKHNVHTCLDTSGYLFKEDDKRYSELIKYVDIFLLDIKHIDDEMCIKLTGKSNKNTLDFATFLSNNNKDMYIRYVLLDNYTNIKEYIIKTKEFIDTLKTVKKVEVLPYHKMAIKKYDELKIEYKIKDINPPSEKDILYAKEILCNVK